MGNEGFAESLPELEEPTGGKRANAEILGTIDQSEADDWTTEVGTKVRRQLLFFSTAHLRGGFQSRLTVFI